MIQLNLTFLFFSLSRWFKINLTDFFDKNRKLSVKHCTNFESCCSMIKCLILSYKNKFFIIKQMLQPVLPTAHLFKGSGRRGKKTVNEFPKTAFMKLVKFIYISVKYGREPDIVVHLFDEQSTFTFKCFPVWCTSRKTFCFLNFIHPLRKKEKKRKERNKT